MKIFQTIQKQYAMMGISPTHPWTQKSLFNKKIAFGLLLFAYCIVSQMVFILHVASGFMEYMEAICSSSATVIMFICFVAIVLRKTKLFESIENIEKLIDTSEPNHLVD